MRKVRPARRGRASAIGILLGLLRVLGPLFVIALVAYWFLNYTGRSAGLVRVTSSVSGAEILVGGIQTGFVTDTTVEVPLGRRIITVRKSSFVSDPEFAVVEVRRDRSTEVRFILKDARKVVTVDTIPPLNPRQALLSTGEPLRPVSAAEPRRGRSLVDFADVQDLAPDMSDFIPRASVSTTPDVGVPVATALQATQVTVSSDPEGAEIWVNGAPTTRVTPYTFHGLDRGMYVFRVSREGFAANPESTSISLVRDAQSELVAFELLSAAALPKPTLTVATAPLAAGIRVNGSSAGVGKTVLELEYGRYRIDFADVPGYKTPDATVVMLTADKPTADVRGEYLRLVGNAFLVVAPGDGAAAFDARALRVYVDGELILDGPQQKFDAALLGKVLAGKRLVRMEYGDLADDVHVNFLDGQASEVTFRVESFFSKRSLRLRPRSPVSVEEWRERSKKLNVLVVS